MNAALNTLIPFDLACAQLKPRRSPLKPARGMRESIAETAVLAHRGPDEGGSVSAARGLG